MERVQGMCRTLATIIALAVPIAAAEFWCVDRLRNEINTFPDGRADIHEHPLEPFMVRSRCRGSSASRMERCVLTCRGPNAEAAPAMWCLSV